MMITIAYPDHVAARTAAGRSLLGRLAVVVLLGLAMACVSNPTPHPQVDATGGSDVARADDAFVAAPDETDDKEASADADVIDPSYGMSDAVGGDATSGDVADAGVVADGGGAPTADPHEQHAGEGCDGLDSGVPDFSHVPGRLENGDDGDDDD